MRKSIITLIILFSLDATFSFSEDKGKCIKGDCANGVGVYLYDNGIEYSGEFKDDKRNGKGSLTIPEEIKPSSSTIFNWFGGSSYNGQWKEGKRYGQGMFIWPDGAKYVGEWKGGRHGQGTFTWPDGAQYIGGWKEDKMWGKGLMIWPDGKKYEGVWENNTIVQRNETSLDEEKSYVQKLYEKTDEELKSEEKKNVFTEKVDDCFNKTDLRSEGAFSVVVEKKVINVREEPHLESAKLRSSVKGDLLKVIDKKDDWLRVIDNDCKIGWVAAWLFDVKIPDIKATESNVAENIEKNTPTVESEIEKKESEEETKVVASSLNEAKDQVVEKKPEEVVGDKSNDAIALDDVFEKKNSCLEDNHRTPGTKSTILTIERKVINLRDVPNLNSNVLVKLTQGESVKVVNQNGDWLEIIDEKCNQGWVASWLFKEYEKEAQSEFCSQYSKRELAVKKLVKVDNKALNLRDKPSLNGSVVGKLANGQEIKVLKSYDEWIYVVDRKCQIGWAASWLTTLKSKTKGKTSLQSKGGSVAENKKNCLKISNNAIGQVKIVKVNRKVVNLRDRPDLVSNVIKKLNEGDELLVLVVNGQWFNVIDATCHTGWIANWLVE